MGSATVGGSAVGAYMGIGARAGTSTSEITLNDGLDYINPYVFNGSFDVITLGASLGRGFGYSAVNLGGAHAKWASGWYHGADVGLTSGTGRSSVKSTRFEECTCEK